MERLVARVALGGVHLAVGAAEQLLRRRTVVGEDRPADRGVDLDDVAVDPIRASERMTEPSDEDRRLVLGARPK